MKVYVLSDNGELSVYPSVEALADKTGIHRITLGRAFKKQGKYEKQSKGVIAACCDLPKQKARGNAKSRSNISW